MGSSVAGSSGLVYMPCPLSVCKVPVPTVARSVAGLSTVGKVGRIPNPRRFGSLVNLADKISLALSHVAGTSDAYCLSLLDHDGIAFCRILCSAVLLRDLMPEVCVLICAVVVQLHLLLP